MTGETPRTRRAEHKTGVQVSTLSSSVVSSPYPCISDNVVIDSFINSPKINLILVLEVTKEGTDDNGAAEIHVIGHGNKHELCDKSVEPCHIGLVYRLTK